MRNAPDPRTKVSWARHDFPLFPRCVGVPRHGISHTPHAFHADYRPSYRKAQADDGWKRATDWFKKHGV